jgi:hypothetical protein
MNKDTVTVYWTMSTMLDRQTLINLMWEDPTPFVKTISKVSNNPEKGYRQCTAASVFWRNLFVIKSGISSHAVLTEEYDNPNLFVNEGNYWQTRNSGLDKTHRLDLDFSWLFFSEESVIIQQTPPYFHNTTAQNYGAIAPGSFDISKWYRPINLTYLLWENINELKIKENEPLAYLQFLTDKKVVLKRFENTPEIASIMFGVAELKNHFPRESLEKLYKRFTRSNRHKRLAKLIKENIVE